MIPPERTCAECMGSLRERADGTLRIPYQHRHGALAHDARPADPAPAPMTHDDTARAIASGTGWDLDGYAADAGWSGVGIGPVGEHRDSDALDASNFRVILDDLTARYPGAVERVEFGHWAVGWVAEIAHDTGRPDVTAAVAEWRERLDGYPVASDDDYAALEDNRNHPTAAECYSDADDCGCRARRRAHLRYRIGRPDHRASHDPRYCARCAPEV
jgi:hypothetical protein